LAGSTELHPPRAFARRASRCCRGTVAIGLAWAVIVSAIALYERFTVDPWRFVGEDRHAIFFDWSPYLVYDKSTFGDFVLVFDFARFAAVLLLPIAALIAVAWVLRWSIRVFRRPPQSL
jgi:hypothetical protein